MSCALLDSGSRDIAGLAVDLKDGYALASHVPRTSFEWVLGSRSADDNSFGNRALGSGARVERYEKRSQQQQQEQLVALRRRSDAHRPNEKKLSRA